MLPYYAFEDWIGSCVFNIETQQNLISSTAGCLVFYPHTRYASHGGGGLWCTCDEPRPRLNISVLYCDVVRRKSIWFSLIYTDDLDRTASHGTCRAVNCRVCGDHLTLFKDTAQLFKSGRSAKNLGVIIDEHLTLQIAYPPSAKNDFYKLRKYMPYDLTLQLMLPKH